MANSLTNIQELTPASLTQFRGTIRVILDGDAGDTLTISTSGQAPEIEEVFAPEAGKSQTITISVSGVEE